ncbi:hypothetical protein [Nostoc sp.]|uniref:hypothetical protein n=1 Tax=Nostoc sp. TaxID=1180 RepID=UPI002FF7E034
MSDKKPLPRIVQHIPSIGILLVEYPCGKCEAYRLLGKAGLEYANSYTDYLRSQALYRLRYDE